MTHNKPARYEIFFRHSMEEYGATNEEWKSDIIPRLKNHFPKLIEQHFSVFVEIMDDESVVILKMVFDKKIFGIMDWETRNFIEGWGEVWQIVIGK